MTKRTEKTFRDELADKKLAPEYIDILVKAERDAGRLDDEDDGDEDDEDEGDGWDRRGEELAKARQRYSDELAKAESIKVDVYSVGTPGGGGSPEQRTATERYPIDDEIDDISEGEALRDIAKAFDAASGPRFEALEKAFGAGLRAAVKRIESRLAAQDVLIDHALADNNMIAKAVRKQSAKFADLQKALDNTPAPRTPKYRVDDLSPSPRPGDKKGPKVSVAALNDWLGDQIEKASSGSIGLEERQQIDRYYEAMQELDRSPQRVDDIANEIGFKPA